MLLHDANQSTAPPGQEIPMITMLFEDVGGRPVPRLAFTPEGALRKPDGVRYFDLPGAVAHFKDPEDYLTTLWMSTCGEFAPDVRPPDANEARMLFEDVDGTAVPLLPDRGDGSPVVADGVKVLSIEQAAHRFGMPADRLKRIWKAAWGEFFQDRNDDKPTADTPVRRASGGEVAILFLDGAHEHVRCASIDAALVHLWRIPQSTRAAEVAPCA
jgi:hypothetical protein